MSTKKNENLDHDLNVIEDVKEPSYYRVLLHNDDYTPMDFVIYVLKKFFSKNETDANKIMLDVHKQGLGVAGIFSFEVAETKVMQVNQFAKNSQYPLKSSYEKEE